MYLNGDLFSGRCYNLGLSDSMLSTIKIYLFLIIEIYLYQQADFHHLI